MNDEDTAGVIAPPPLIFAIPLGVGLVLQRFQSARLGLPRVMARPLGLTLIALGAYLGPAAFRSMRRSGTHPDPRTPAKALVVVGPFRYSRNPLYLTMTLIYAGITLLANARWPVIFLPSVLLVIRRGVIDREERYLERRFGEEYREYKRQVRRWI
ncbi:MAG: isoprenylcysteine carboxylmethyltransferase family protein [Chloroflexota bacterium]|nr:isoprenylcysteine carboxylmethyltransferase family protein [Chloroflexota bacterium]